MTGKRGAKFMRVSRIATAVVISAVALVIAGGVTARNHTLTSVSIYSGQDGGFHGNVQSVKESCDSGRRVHVFKLLGGNYDLENDRPIGSDASGHAGRWSIDHSGLKHGRFYAHVRKTHGCNGAFSRVLER
jgi:hypothetical protein